MGLFKFSTLNTTTLVVVVYATIWAAVLFTYDLPPVPPAVRSAVDQANADLHQIAARPHAYNSHANDLVHHYLLNRLNAIAAQHPHVHVLADTVSNASWVGNNIRQGVYFEGTNILVKIDGDENEGAVLFSAHYDSVSTAPGVTDNGMGVATLLHMVEVLAEKEGGPQCSIPIMARRTA